MKGFNINKLARDKQLAREGVVVDCGAGLEIRVVCMHDSAAYKEFLMRKGKTLRRGLERGQTDVEGLRTLQAEGVAKYILKGWNLTEYDAEGVERPVPLDEANVMRMFDKAPELLDIIVEEASNVENFRAQVTDSETLEADAKN